MQQKKKKKKTIFNIDNNEKCHIRTIILECFMKDHVTLKAGEMILKIASEELSTFKEKTVILNC